MALRYALVRTSSFNISLRQVHPGHQRMEAGQCDTSSSSSAPHRAQP